MDDMHDDLLLCNDGFRNLKVAPVDGLKVVKLNFYEVILIDMFQ